MKINLKDVQKNCTVAGELLISQASIRKTKTGKDYLDCTLTDGRSTINAKMWDTSEVPTGPVVHIEAIVTEFNNTLQLTLTSCEMSDVTIEQFAPTRGYNLDAAYTYLVNMANTLEEGGCKAFVDELFFNNEEALFKATAAVGMHHVQAGGLIQHTYEVVNYAVQICEAQEQQGLSLINKSLLIAGAMLHDIGKLVTYQCNEQTSQFEMTMQGKFYEHIIAGIQMVAASDAASKYPQIALLLEHIIAAHHGKLEYGSPVVPCMVEAMVINFADELSAKTDMILKALEDKPETAQWTAKLPVYGREILDPRVVTNMHSIDCL